MEGEAVFVDSFFTFCYFFLLFVTFVNYFLLLKGGKVCCFNLFFDCSGGGGAPIHMFITNFFYC